VAGICTLGASAIRLLMDGQSKASIGAVYLLTGHPHMRQAIHRINHEVAENLYRLDDDVGERSSQQVCRI
jgi:hypothetical protein